MKLLIADECSLTWDSKVGYFMYGGIVVDEADARPLAEGLLKIKAKYEIPKVRPIKWNNVRWDSITLDKDVHKNIKDETLTLFSNSPAKIIICMSPHQFYHNPTLKNDGEVTMSIEPETQTRSHEYGMNDVLAKFNRYLGEDGYGMVFADKFGEPVKDHMNQHCANIFPGGTALYSFPNIVSPVIQLENEESYLHQINDVVLGAIYVSLKEMGHNFLPRIKDNFWTVDIGFGPKINGHGFNIYPIRPRYEWCEVANRNLQAKFNRLINQV